MSDNAIFFTPKSKGLTSVDAFKERVLKGFQDLDSTRLDFEDKDWRTLLSDVRHTLMDHEDVAIMPVLNTPESGKLPITQSLVDIDFAVGKSKKPINTGSKPEEVEAARSGLPTSIMTALKL